jgi:hypothetical protein
MKIELNSQQTEQQILTYHRTSLIDESAVTKWHHLKAQYALYTDMVRELQFHYFRAAILYLSSNR